MEHLLDELRLAVGERNVLVDPEVVASYTRDWTGRFLGDAPFVVRPADTAEVAAVLERCALAGVAVVPQGGNTGLVGGSVPLSGEAVISLRRLRQVEPVDRAARQVTVGAGATLADVHEVARGAGLAFGVDIGARDSATIGGMVATNAGGIHVVRHGPMRSQVVGIEAVMSTGEVVSRLGGLEKDNTGYDLAGLLCGSEGTLAVVTRVRLRLVASLDQRVVSLVACETAAGAVRLAAAVRAIPGLSAVEAFWRSAARLVSAHLGVAVPVGDPPVIVLIEVAAGSDVEAAAEELAGVIESVGLNVDEAIVATGPGGQLNLWRFRESITEAISTVGVPIKLDVTLPAATLADFADSVPGIVAAVAPAATTHLFGHLGDGNVHVNVVAPDGIDLAAETIEDVVLSTVAAAGGSISAEHGIGTAKARWLHLARSPVELALFERLRQAWDPAGILNPAVLRPSVG